MIGGTRERRNGHHGSDVALPASIRRVVELGVRAVDPARVILYGSRARGGAREDSDYDLAFIFPELSPWPLGAVPCRF